MRGCWRVSWSITFPASRPSSCRTSPAQAATAAEAHNRLMLTKALDLSAKRKQPVKLPLEPGEDCAAA